jgi:hypothetical protein
MGTDIAEEAVQSAQTHIPGAGCVVSVCFQVLQKGRDSRGRQLFQGQLTVSGGRGLNHFGDRQGG